MGLAELMNSFLVPKTADNIPVGQENPQAEQENSKNIKIKEYSDKIRTVLEPTIDKSILALKKFRKEAPDVISTSAVLLEPYYEYARKSLGEIEIEGKTVKDMVKTTIDLKNNFIAKTPYETRKSMVYALSMGTFFGTNNIFKKPIRTFVVYKLGSYLLTPEDSDPKIEKHD